MPNDPTLDQINAATIQALRDDAFYNDFFGIFSPKTPRDRAYRRLRDMGIGLNRTQEILDQMECLGVFDANKATSE